MKGVRHQSGRGADTFDGHSSSFCYFFSRGLCKRRIYPVRLTDFFPEPNPSGRLISSLLVLSALPAQFAVYSAQPCAKG